jgi:hypothetical protein
MMASGQSGVSEDPRGSVPKSPPGIGRSLVRAVDAHRSAALATFVCLCAATGRVFWKLSQTVDLARADEAAYLLSGEQFIHTGLLPGLQWSPGYGIWYGVVALVSPDPVTAFFLQLYAVVALTAGLLWWYLLRIGISSGMATVGALLWVTQASYTAVDNGIGWPRPYHAAFALVLGGGIALQNRLSLPRVLVALGYLLLAATVRVEYMLSACAFAAGVSAVWLVRHRRSRLRLAASRAGYRASTLLASASVPLAALLVIIYAALRTRAFFDAALFSVDRLWFAFGQKFALWYLPQTPLRLNAYDDFEVVLSRAFPGAHSIFGAVLVNPNLFLRFEWFNLHALAGVLASIPEIQPYPRQWEAVAILTLLGLIVRLVSRSLRPRDVWHGLTECLPVLGYLTATALAIVPSVIVQPALVYSLGLLFLAFMVMILLANRCVPDWNDVIVAFHGLELKGSFFHVALLLVAFSWVASTSPLDRGSANRIQFTEVTRMAAVLARYEELVPGEVRVLDIGGIGFCAYLQYGLCHEVDASWRKDGESLSAFLARERIGAILVTPRLTDSRSFRDDPLYRAMIADPEAWRWSATELAPGDLLLLPRPEVGDASRVSHR